jgi:hypothetical protein
MHDQSASRISGRTRAAVSAMCVRALRITVLKSAGDFTRDECHDLNAEKIQRVKCFMFTSCGICCVPAIFERRRGQLGPKISDYGQLAEVAVYPANVEGMPATRWVAMTMWRHWVRQNNPTGKSAKTCPALQRKIFRLTRRANQRYQLARLTR